MGRLRPLVLVAIVGAVSVAGAAACADDDAGGGSAATVPAGPTAEELDDLTSDEARSAFEDGDIPAGTAVARLEIAAAGIDAVARSGSPDAAVLHVAGSALPCGPGLAVFIGSARSSFAALAATEVDDELEVQTPVSRCTYEVTQSATVETEDLDLAGGGDRRPGSIVLATPSPEGEDLSRVVVAELDEDSIVEVADPAAPTTSTTEPVVAAPRPTGREAIDALLDAWRAGDRAAALAVAREAAVEAMFAVPVEPAQDRGCTQGEANIAVTCVFRLVSGELQVRAAPVDGGFVVELVLLSPH